MWSIIFPVSTLPLLGVLFLGHFKAKRANPGAYVSYFPKIGAMQIAKDLFWYLDVVGIFLLIALLALILVPFTLAGGAPEQWRQAKIIAPLVIGLCLVPAWIFWERWTKHPMVPFRVCH